MTMQWLLYVFVFCSAALGFHAVLGMGRQVAGKVNVANFRLKQLEKNNDSHALLARMRRDRSIGKDGKLKALNTKLGTLVLQSGIRLGANGIYGFMLLGGLMGTGLGFVFLKTPLWMMACGAAGTALPVLVLAFLVKRRRARAVSQLPDALDVIIRSLRAGHPVPVALAMVANEMPDPIGSEFGIVIDEIAYGSGISSAIQRMAERVGQEDYDLFAAMIRLQEKTGANLAELLASNANTIRARQRMRLKIKAVSAEGRMSAMILNAAPIGLFCLIRVAAPDFYGEVEDAEIMKYAFWVIGFWMLIGNLVMKKMINFKI